MLFGHPDRSRWFNLGCKSHSCSTASNITDNTLPYWKWLCRCWCWLIRLLGLGSIWFVHFLPNSDCAESHVNPTIERDPVCILCQSDSYQVQMGVPENNFALHFDVPTSHQKLNWNGQDKDSKFPYRISNISAHTDWEANWVNAVRATRQSRNEQVDSEPSCWDANGKIDYLNERIVKLSNYAGCSKFSL